MIARPAHNDDAPDPSPADHAAWAQARLRRQVMVLEDLAETGLKLAQAIERRVTEAASDEALSCEALAKEGMAFARVARAVRMTALLQSKLVRELEPIDKAVAEQAEDAEARQDPAYGHKARVEAIVARVAQDAFDDEELLTQAVQETAERLDDDDIYGDVLTRPVGELVALICRDLGLEPDWTQLAEEAWAQEEIRLGPEGSPFLPGSRRPTAEAATAMGETIGAPTPPPSPAPSSPRPSPPT